jgi:hypothetical protein
MVQNVIPHPIKKADLQSFGKQDHKGGGQRQTIDIIRESARNEMPPGSDIESIIKQVALLIQRKAVKLLQLGNTVFLLHPQKDGSVEFHTFTVEKPEQLIQRYKAAANSLRQMGYKRAVSYAQSPAFTRIAQSTGLPVKVTQTVRRMGQQMQPVYQFEVDL